MSQVNKRDIEAIKDWLAKEPYLPKTFDDKIIKKFLFSCHCSLERTKKCIEIFCTARANMPEIYSNRDPLSKKVQQVFSTTSVTFYMDGTNEVLIHMIKEVPSDFDFYALLKASTTQVDNWLKTERDLEPENHIIVMDIKEFTLKLISKINIFYFKDFVTMLLEGMPLRLREIHCINCPSYYEYMFNILKPAIPEFLSKMMHFHPDHTGLHNFINKESLPKEYGGENRSMEEKNADVIKTIVRERDFYLDDNLWKADLSLKVKNDSSDNSMIGSFKTLDID